MTTYFVSRHPGAIAWAERQGLPVDQQIRHLEISSIQAGDTVIGTLPMNLAARVCESGGRYIHLTLELPLEKRGQELSADDLDHYGAVVEEYLVRKRPVISPLNNFNDSV